MLRLSSDNFEEVVNGEKGLFVIKFSSPTCGPCATMAPVFEALNSNNDHVNVYEVDVMESPEIANHFGVRGVPFVTYCENREVLYTFTGVTPLGNLQYVIDHIDDEYFREHGEFQQSEVKKSKWFEIAVVCTLAFIAALFFLL